MKKQSVYVIPTVIATLLAGGAWGQIPMSAGTYYQNFDSLLASGTANAWADNTTLPGWYAAKTNGGPVTTYRAGTGSATVGALYSFGASGSSERALGSLGSDTPGNIAYAAVFTNDTGSAQDNVTLTYTGEQWRNGGDVNQQNLFCDYQVSLSPLTLDADTGGAWLPLPALDFYGPTFSDTSSALDGNNPTNRQTFANVVLTGVTVQPGEILVLRWLDLNDAGGDHGLAIDDLTVVFPGVIPVTNAPAITTQPLSGTNNAGTAVHFSVTATGTEPLRYQWRRAGTNLSDTGNIVGAQTAALTVNNVRKADGGGFDVVITNVAGAVTSAVATLTVIDPAINTQPMSRTNVPGDVVTFSVSAAGTPSLKYQWTLQGTNLPEETSSSCQITNLTAAHAGGYAVIVSNSLGVVTSAVAVLTVVPTPATRFAHWDFNHTNAPSTTNEPAIAFGTGSASILGEAIGSFATGSGSDPGGLSGGTNNGWNTASYPAQGTSNKTSGVQFRVNTVGYTNLLITWQERHTSTASKYMRFQYSTNGTDFVDQNVLTIGADSVFAQCVNDLSSVPGVANNPSFAFRIVAEWESTATSSGNDRYLPTTAANYSAAGAIRFDMVNVFGDPLGGVVWPDITEIRVAGNTVEIDFTAGASDPPSAFSVVSASTVNGAYAPAGGSVASLGAGKFRATLTASGSQQFYQIKR